MDTFGHYRNQNPVMHPWDMPQWLNEGIQLLSHIENVEEERKRNQHGR